MADDDEAPRGDAGHVVVVDDEKPILDMLARTLRRAGHRVSTFGDPLTFVAEARLDPPCCVILDFHMPGMNGAQVQERLAVLEHPPAIIFMSGGANVQTSVQAMKAGAIDFLEKPFDTQALLAAVEAALRRARERLASWNEVRAARARLARLTPRERQVCALVAKGLRSKEIADRLGAAVKTVNIHRSRILAKLEIDSPVELARIVERAGEERD